MNTSRFFGVEDMDAIREWQSYFPKHNARNMIIRYNNWVMKNSKTVLLQPKKSKGKNKRLMSIT